MSRFTVEQEITVAKTQGDVTYGKFYTVTHINDGDACILDDAGDVDHITDDFGLTREEYEQAEREKDPFAPGKWVVCVEDDSPARKGDIIQVLEASDVLGCFRVWDTIESSGHAVCFKSHFRPATPEEIKEQEMKIMDEKKADEARANRQTFTVGGREFYVGQAVWSTEDGGILSEGDELEVLGAYPESDTQIIVRKPGTWHDSFGDVRYITTTKPKPHEWKFGDWARHPKIGVVFVMGVNKEYACIEVVRGYGELFCLRAGELTYISTAEIPE